MNHMTSYYDIVCMLYTIYYVPYVLYYVVCSAQYVVDHQSYDQSSCVVNQTTCMVWNLPYRMWLCIVDQRTAHGGYSMAHSEWYFGSCTKCKVHATQGADELGGEAPYDAAGFSILLLELAPLIWYRMLHAL